MGRVKGPEFVKRAEFFCSVGDGGEWDGLDVVPNILGPVGMLCGAVGEKEAVIFGVDVFQFAAERVFKAEGA